MADIAATPVSFRTDRGAVVPAVTTSEMREVDRIAVEETGPSLFQMMENAGRSLAAVALSVLGGSSPAAEVVVLAGTGGNGGGGLAGGRHLANRGVKVLAIVTDVSRLAPVPGAQRDLLRHAGGEVIDATGAHDAGRHLAAADLVVDALIGYSLRSAPHGVAAELIEAANHTAAPVLSLDVPSGLDATSGEAPGAVVRAHTTLTLALPKTGLTVEEVGNLLLADLGIPAEVYARLGKPLAGPIFDERWVIPLEPA